MALRAGFVPEGRRVLAAMLAPTAHPLPLNDMPGIVGLFK